MKLVVNNVNSNRVKKIINKIKEFNYATHKQ